jgi:hypothetical protein
MAPKFRILVGTHHKTGTIWMHETFLRIALATKLQFTAMSNREDPEPADITLAHHSQFSPRMLGGEYRGLHVIRDPRDIVISGLHYHRKSDEGWLHLSRPKLGGLSYQQKLNSLDPDDQFSFELENAAMWTVEELLGWRYDNPRFHEARYEELIVDAKGEYFGRILRFLGFDEAQVDHGLAVFLRTGIFNKPQPANDPHIRSGKPAQWKGFYHQWHGRRFVEVFGDCLIRLGYEPDNEWVGHLPD